MDTRVKPGHDEFASLRRLRVILNRRARAHKVAVAIDVVDASDRAPVFVRARDAVGETARGTAIGAVPRIIDNVVHGVRGVAQGRGLDLPAANLDLRDLAPD